jgi:hypothetical protein
MKQSKDEIKTVDIIIMIVGTLTGSVIAALAVGILAGLMFADLLVISSAGSLIAISARFIAISRTHNITPKNKIINNKAVSARSNPLSSARPNTQPKQ